LDVLAANDMLSLPNLHSLIINVNRIKSLPCVSTWQSLSVLAAEENRLTEIPVGFVDLKNVKTVDFTGNNITRVDEKIGLIESLSTFKIANNPLRERKLLSMSSDEIIQDLRNRCEPDPQDTDDEGSVATQFTLAPETPELENGWRVKPGGILDRSYSDLTDLETDKIALINSEDIRCVYLQHNELQFFPVPALTMLTQGLVELDLSHNPLKSSDLMSSSLELPKLQSLNLSAAGLTSLESLLQSLQAPSLNFLDVSKNRLTGSLPHIRRTFLELKTFLASDNQISSVEFEAVQGLQVLDISNNDIDYLPPKIGLLGAERSPQNWGTGSALRRFEVAGNRFRVPRWQVVAKGTDAVLEFLKDHIPTQDLPEWEHEDAAAGVDTF
jgi:Leucine-rich repeat (LRR) protein